MTIAEIGLELQHTAKLSTCTEGDENQGKISTQSHTLIMHAVISYTISHTQFYMNRVKTCMHNKCMGMSRNLTLLISHKYFECNPE